MAFRKALVVTAGALIVLTAQPVSASEGRGDFAMPLAGPAFAAAASSARLGRSASILKARGNSSAVVQTVGFAAAAGVGDGACGAAACTDRATRQAVNPSAATTPPSHVLLLAAVGAVAFMARRRRIGG